MNFITKTRSIFNRSISKSLCNFSRRNIVHSSSTDRSFRIATITDLLVAQKYKDKLSSTTSLSYGYYPNRTELRDRDIGKQFVIDLSHPQGFKRGHIPGAINVPTSLFDFSKQIDTFDGVRENDVVELLRYIGVPSNTSEIILYDNTGLNSCRMWLVLRYFGVTNIRILNGGFSAYQRTGLPIDEGEVKPKSTSTICTRKPRREYLITKPGQMSFLHQNKHNEFKFIDTRDPQEFKKYHIKGSYNAPSSNLMNDAQFKSVKEITSYIDTLGFGPETKFKLYSEQRFSSAVAAFCFELIGRNVSVYDAGINNWKLNFDDDATLSDDAREFLQH